MNEGQIKINVNKQTIEIPRGKIELRDDLTKQKWTVDNVASTYS